MSSKPNKKSVQNPDWEKQSSCNQEAPQAFGEASEDVC
jgi:hypothetical protein